ncbi:MAG TPA: histidine kinase, partial [Bacteroidia bacterium]|nr:histidine kinase [Bacteroidia bacterium]
LHLYLIGLFYLNAYVLVPRIMYGKNVAVYVAAILLLVVCTGAVISLSFPPPHGHRHHHYADFFFSSVLPGFFVIAVSASYRIILDRLKSERALSNRINETLKTELSFLRSQISPHFMFNVLNNTVALARKKSELLEPTLIKLSHLMRYMLYDSDESKVSLERETEYLRNYIELQKQRFGEELKLQVEINSSSRDDIEPMLLIPFVENAFKHGTGMIENPEIDIHLRTWDHELLFSVTNKYNPDSIEEKDANSGIGLKNVERRLKLLYGDHYQLEMGGQAHTYRVLLKIKFK